jgi:anti-sigma factor RsiW
VAQSARPSREGRVAASAVSDDDVDPRGIAKAGRGCSSRRRGCVLWRLLGVALAAVLLVALVVGVRTAQLSDAHPLNATPPTAAERSIGVLTVLRRYNVM